MNELETRAAASSDDVRGARALELLEQYLSDQALGRASGRERFLEQHGELRELLEPLLEDHLRVRARLHSAFLGGGEDRNGRRVHESGDRIGDFRLRELVGRGAMGEVWEAEQLSLGGRSVALKFVRPDKVSEKLLARFEVEARAGGRLSHPGVVGVHAVGTCEAGPWIAMELVEDAHTLVDWIDRARQQEILPGYDREVARLIAEVADAVHCAHEAGIVHRDLKPQNILMTCEGRPKVADFGLALISDEAAISASGETPGTYCYMSPEQVSNERGKLDRRSDVFSLGVILYELLTLQRPFVGDTAQVAYRILRVDPPDPRSIRSRISPELATLCRKALHKAPAQRYATMADFAADLRNWLCNRPVAAQEPTRGQRLAKWARRHPTLSSVLGLGGVSVALLSVSLAFAIEERNKATKRASELAEIATIGEFERLAGEADRLWPVEAVSVAAYEDWLGRALHLAERAGAMAAVERGGDPWWRARLVPLVESVEQLAGDGVTREYGWGVRKRMSFARILAQPERSSNARALWSAAAHSLRAGPAANLYRSLELPEQAGLLPLGRDPRSGLWEFAHLASGEPPERDPATEELAITERSGIVFVLIPGRAFTMGAQNGDPLGRNYDAQALPDEGPLVELELAAFLISKFELTQGQWQRLAGWNPSMHRNGFDSGSGPVGPLHPVEDVSWEDAEQVLRRFALDFPTEAQWEFAARAGSEHAWSTGPDEGSLRYSANLADESARRQESGLDWSFVDWDDGYVTHAPVGQFLPNGFGLHDVHGNVAEWCKDWDALAVGAFEPGTCERIVAAAMQERKVSRGGAFNDGSALARSARRIVKTPSTRSSSIGLRPARALGEP